MPSARTLPVSRKQSSPPPGRRAPPRAGCRGGAARPQVAVSAPPPPRPPGGAAAQHRVVEALAGSGGDHAGGIAGKNHVMAVIPAAERLERDRSALPSNSLGAGEARRFTELGGGGAEGKAFLHAAEADAGGGPVREHPAVEVGGNLALIVDLADRPIGTDRRADDLMIGKHIAHTVGAPDFRRAGNARFRPVGTDNRACPDRERRALALRRGLAAMDQRRTVGLALKALKNSSEPFGARPLGPDAEPFVEMLAVDHADEAIADRHVGGAMRGRVDAGRASLGDEKRVGNFEVLDQSGRNCAATRLDPAASVEQEDFSAAPGKIVGGGRTRGATTNNHRVIDVFGSGHAVHPLRAKAVTSMPST